MTTGNAFCQHCGAAIAAESRFCNQCGQPQPTAAPAAAPAYAAPAPAYVAPPVPAITVQYAGFWVRFLAYVLDAIIVGVVTGPITFIVQIAAGLHRGFGASGEIGPQNLAMIAGLLAFVVTFSIAAHALYEALLTASSKQATVGKMVFNLKVTDLQGQRISIPRAFGRHFAKYISGMILMIGYIMQPFTEKRQALHDMIAGTLVLKQLGPPYAIVPPQAAVVR